ncbi:MAG: hypothetical protein LBR90_03100 [Elusimicrobiota bacterium]|nr:hypothetical protein [Elusimicrobiota bacterium]
MKKIVLLAAFCALTLPALAITATDPLYMLPQGGMLLDSEFAYNSNYHGGDKDKYWNIKETFKYGITDVWEVYGSLGLGNMSLEGPGPDGAGLIDPEFGVKYRATDSAFDAFNVDLSAFFGPSLFDSPMNGDDGAAKGTTDFGFKALLGTNAGQWTYGGYAGLEFVGSSDGTKSATDMHLGGVGKYYIDEVNSLDGDLSLNLYGKRVDGGDSDTSVKLMAGYSRVLNGQLDVSGFLGFASHSAQGAKGEAFLGARLRWKI